MTLPHETVLCQYRYDALDRLVGQIPATTPEHQRFYNQSRLATEIQGTMRHSIFQQGDLLLAQQRSSDVAIDTSLLATDQQRSVLHTCKDNQQRKAMAYSPYGYRAIENGLLSLLGFNGERQDPVTGHYLLGNGYRTFNPALMRFNSPDSFSPFGKGGLNAYGYCLGDPINGHDPSGHIPKFPKILSRKFNTPDYLDEADKIIKKNDNLNHELMNKTFLRDYRTALNTPPLPRYEIKKPSDIAANLTIDQLDSLPPYLQGVVYSKKARELLPLYEYLSSAPQYSNTITLSHRSFGIVNKAIKEKTQLPEEIRGINFMNIDAYLKKLQSIKNPKHYRNIAKAEALKEKYNKSVNLRK
ncbi:MULTISPECIES: RHS repeat-associated core domain-containing protein [unclassified Pseudomonas]|uniref:RHS repeat-associated core domain-containing protein n=1 Tax=unclassified Pseudomonas TaxID=196821 RepID=UPI000703607C|nr:MULTISPECIES: RHS repeat-associated core domain-containing protein [unclassified Pseudomonas]KQZ78815.1 hypothetical protein ASD60_18010 [Pseudomonas sp. Root562]